MSGIARTAGQHKPGNVVVYRSVPPTSAGGGNCNVNSNIATLDARFDQYVAPPRFEAAILAALESTRQEPCA